MTQDTSATPRGSDKRNWSFVIPRKLAVAICSLVLLAMCVFWLISNFNTRNILRQQADLLGNAIATQTALMVTDLVLANDLISMNVVLGQLTNSSAISEAAILNVDGGVIAASSRYVEQPRRFFPIAPQSGEYLAGITLPAAVAGQVRIRLDLTPIEQGLLNNFLFVVAATGLLLIVAAALVITYVQHVVSFPLRLLAFCLHGITRGEMEACPEPRDNNEVGRTVKQYNKVVQFLTRYTFIGNIANHPDGEDVPRGSEGEATATVLCIRMANFQYLASTHNESTIVTLLNRYYFFAEKISQLYNGTLCYCADGEIVINFDAVTLEEEQGFYAMCAGHLFLTLIETICDDPTAESMPAKFRLAVHSGPVIAGLYSPLNQKTNLIMGQTLDTTRQICEECPDNALLVSEVVYDSAGAGTRVEGELFSSTSGSAAGIFGQDRLRIWLSNSAMSGFGTLVEKQAHQLVSLYDTDPEA
ncbi:MAG: hypothetical protein WDZ76_11470 [Pseudohongiellaceae bacterium]